MRMAILLICVLTVLTGFTAFGAHTAASGKVALSCIRQIGDESVIAIGEETNYANIPIPPSISASTRSMTVPLLLQYAIKIPNMEEIESQQYHSGGGGETAHCPTCPTTTTHHASPIYHHQQPLLGYRPYPRPTQGPNYYPYQPYASPDYLGLRLNDGPKHGSFFSQRPSLGSVPQVEHPTGHPETAFWYLPLHPVIPIDRYTTQSYPTHEQQNIEYFEKPNPIMTKQEDILL